MANIIFRQSTTATIPSSTIAKEAPLTNLELDGNFRSLNVNKVEIDDTLYIGTTPVILNRSSAAQTLTGISIDGNAGTVTDGVYLSTVNIFTDSNTFRHSGGVRTEGAATKDAVVLMGRNGGADSYAVTITPTTLTGNRTITLPDANGTLIHDGGSYNNPSWITALGETKVLPSQTNQEGKYLTTNGTSTSWGTVAAGATNLDELTDVAIVSPSIGQVLKFNGTSWVNGTDATGEGGGGGGITTGKAIAMAIVFGG